MGSLSTKDLIDQGSLSSRLHSFYQSGHHHGREKGRTRDRGEERGERGTASSRILFLPATCYIILSFLRSLSLSLSLALSLSLSPLFSPAVHHKFKFNMQILLSPHSGFISIFLLFRNSISRRNPLLERKVISRSERNVEKKKKKKKKKRKKKKEEEIFGLRSRARRSTSSTSKCTQLAFANWRLAPPPVSPRLVGLSSNGVSSSSPERSEGARAVIGKKRRKKQKLSEVAFWFST